jgi:uncharacterized cupredoxin-like copper-binding protein
VLGVSALLLLAACGTDETETPIAQSEPGTEAEPEPKDLEAKITIVMGEELPEMYFADTDGERGGTFTLPAGKTVGIRVINSGELEHEIAFGRDYNATDGAFEENLFATVPTDMFVFKPVKVEFEGAVFEEIEAEPQGDFWIRTVFPTEMKGQWEIACFVEGHYDAGMTATFVIE